MSDTQKLVLCLDASAPCSAVAVGRLDTASPIAGSEFLAGDERIDGANQASQTLGQRIRDTLAAAGVEMSQVELIACGRGPGTFTGTRVALATAQGLASGLRCETISLSTLDALAWSHPELAELGDATLLSLLDARRGEIYGRAYQAEAGVWKPVGDAACTPIADFLANLDGPLVAVGPGVEPYRDALPEGTDLLSTEDQLMGPTARGLWAASCAAYASHGSHDVAELQPLYLRATYAELGINKPKRPMFKSPFV